MVINISKKFAKTTLNSFEYYELLEISKQWKVKKPSKEKSKIIEQIYNHQLNPISNFSIHDLQIVNSKCKASSIITCISFDCSIHLQAKADLAFIQRHKKAPTDFMRFSLPICWFVAGTQFCQQLIGLKFFTSFLHRNKRMILQDCFSWLRLLS